MEQIKTLEELLAEGNSIPELKARIDRLKADHEAKMRGIREEHAWRVAFYQLTGVQADYMSKGHSRYQPRTLVVYGKAHDYGSTPEQRMQVFNDLYQKLRNDTDNVSYLRGTYGIICPESLQDKVFEKYGDSMHLHYTAEGFVLRTQTDSSEFKAGFYTKINGELVEVQVYLGSQPALRCSATRRKRSDPVEIYIPDVLKPFVRATFAVGDGSGIHKQFYILAEDPDLVIEAVLGRPNNMPEVELKNG